MSIKTTMMVGSLLAVLCGCATPPKLSPISDSGQWLPGKFIWRDLVTPAPYQSQKFYAEVFGWTFEPVENTGYFLIRSNGEPIGGLVDASRMGRQPQSAVWLSAISVASVDEAVVRVVQEGGKVLHPPTVVPGRGRTAVIEDPSGAVLRMFHTEQGDPPDREAGTNQWLWSELIAADPAAAGTFYQAALGYEMVLSEVAGVPYRVLKQSGLERAGILQNPFENTRSVWIPCIRVVSVQEASVLVSQQGGKVVVAPNPVRRRARLALVLDPAGAPLAIQEWAPTAGNGAVP